LNFPCILTDAIGAVETYPTTVQTGHHRHTATVDPSVLATSNGHVAKDILGDGANGNGMTSKKKSANGATGVRLGLGLGLGVMAVVSMVVGGVGAVVRWV
jgi:hypothetical protein